MMVSKIKINNLFRNIPSMDGIILACDIVGTIESGDLLLISHDLKIRISKVEKNLLYKEINIVFTNEDLNNFIFDYSFIGEEFLIQKMNK